MSNILREKIAEKGFLLADGATGSNLMAQGLPPGFPPELWNIQRPELIKEHYASFIKCGCNIVLTNSFGGSEFRLSLHSDEAANQMVEVNYKAAKLLKDESIRLKSDVIIAGSVGQLGFDPASPLSLEEQVGYFSRQIRALKEGGVDFIWFETMSSLGEVEAALKAANENNIDATVTMSFDTNGHTMMGVKPSQFLSYMNSVTNGKPIAIGANCGAGLADFMASLIELGAIGDDIILITKPNCGIPVYKNGQTSYAGTPEIMADYAVTARNLGAKIIGGCCGTTPEHIVAISDALKNSTLGNRPTLSDVQSIFGSVSEATRRTLFGVSSAHSRRVKSRRIRHTLE